MLLIYICMPTLCSDQLQVFKDGGVFKSAWYSATILELKDGKALLCYTDLQAEDGKMSRN